MLAQGAEIQISIKDSSENAWTHLEVILNLLYYCMKLCGCRNVSSVPSQTQIVVFSFVVHVLGFLVIPECSFSVKQLFIRYLSLGMYHAIGLICSTYCLEHHYGTAVVTFVFNDGENSSSILTMRIVSMDKSR